jgi:hypothetical protein
MQTKINMLPKRRATRSAWALVGWLVLAFAAAALHTIMAIAEWLVKIRARGDFTPVKQEHPMVTSRLELNSQFWLLFVCWPIDLKPTLRSTNEIQHQHRFVCLAFHQRRHAAVQAIQKMGL